MINKPVIFTLALFLLAGRLLPAQESSEQPEQQIALAKQYFQEEKYRQALAIGTKLPRALQSRHDVYQLMLESHLALGAFREAERLARRSIEEQPMGHLVAYVDLYRIYESTEDPKGQQLLLEVIQQRINRQPGLAYNFSRVFQERGYPQMALQMLQAGEEAQPQLNYAYQKALLYGELGKIGPMFESYVAMLEQNPNYLSTVKSLFSRSLTGDVPEEAIAELKKLLLIKIQETREKRYQDLLSHIFIQQENFTGAFIQLKALDRRELDVGNDLYQLAQIAAQNKAYDLALEVYDYLLEQKKNSSWYEPVQVKKLETRLAALEDEAGAVEREQWQELARDYYHTQAQLQAMEPRLMLLEQWAGLLAFKLDEPDSARNVLVPWVERPTGFPEQVAQLKLQLGDILLYMGKRWEALLYYTQVEKTYEQSPLGQLARFKKGQAAYFVGEFEWAQNTFKVLKSSTSKLIANDAMRYSLLITTNAALDSNYEAMAMYARADLMQYQGKLDSALRLLSQMQIAFVEHDIQDEVWLLMGDLQKRQKNYPRAKEAWESLIQEFPKSILADDALQRLAELHENIWQQPEDASAYYRRIFMEHPDSFFAEQARQKFRNLRGETLNP